MYSCRPLPVHILQSYGNPCHQEWSTMIVMIGAGGMLSYKSRVSSQYGGHSSSFYSQDQRADRYWCRSGSGIWLIWEDSSHLNHDNSLCINSSFWRLEWLFLLLSLNSQIELVEHTGICDHLCCLFHPKWFYIFFKILHGWHLERSAKDLLRANEMWKILKVG